jgi:Sulfotransferase domain
MTAGVDVPAPADARKSRAPDFFIVGHPKSGTSALYQMLREHPQIHMPRKEPAFFVPELRNIKRYDGGIADYLALFAGARPEQLIGEATTLYLFSHDAAARIAEARPDARIIAILREPASFLRSLHLQLLQSNVENEPDLRKAIALDGARAEGRSIPRNSARPQSLAYSEHVRYTEQLRRYHAAFPPEQVLVLIYEEFRADNEGTVREVLRFLDLDDAGPVDVIEANPTVGLRSPRAYQTVRSLYLGRSPGARALKGAIKAATPRRLRRRAVGRTHAAQWGSPPPVDPQLMGELRRRYRAEVEAVSDYLGRDLLTVWGYDELT